ncbi:MAG: heparinase II/III domain-containing protein [Kiritimatiellia bacterium]|jgi:hypothetical protein
MKRSATINCAHGIIFCLTALFCAGVNSARAGAERAYYTAAKMAVLKQNLEKYEWARLERDAIIARTDKWLKYDDEKLRTLVPPPNVPRAVIPYEVGVTFKSGDLEMYPYNWQVSFDKPWKLTAPNGREYPSNDFEAFLRSGCKDRSLLTGEFPDDGWGWHVPGEDRKVWFVAYYAHQLIMRHFLPALDDLSRAYLFTDDARYAHACALLLWQVAEYYPRYFYEKQSREGESRPDYRGRMLNRGWECLGPACIAPPAYDAVRPAIENDAALLKLTGLTGAEICDRIESRFLRVMADDIMAGNNRVVSSCGVQQLALLRLGVTLRDSKLIQSAISNPDPKPKGSWYISCLGLEEQFNNLIHGDGFPWSAPHYNTLMLDSFAKIAYELPCLPVKERTRMEEIVRRDRFRKMFTWPMRMICAGEFLPAFGDTPSHAAGSVRERDVFEVAYNLTHDVLVAKALLQMRRDKSGNNKTDLFTGKPRAPDLFCEWATDEELAASAGKYPDVLGVTSELLPGLGWASLQTGTGTNRTALAILYGYYPFHSHWDRLQLDIYSQGHALIPDFGYVTGSKGFYETYIYNTLAHNTVMINAAKQMTKKTCSSENATRQINKGRLHVYDPGAFAQLVEVSSEDCYDDVKLYRRTLMLVDVSPTNAYIVDIFRVRGGKQHDWLVHGPPKAEFKSSLDFGAPVTNGTLAGTNVPYGCFYDDARFTPENVAKRYNKGNVPYWDYRGSGFQWLFNAQEARLSGNSAAGASWHLDASDDVALRAHILAAHQDGQGETVFACDGVPRQGGFSEPVKFLVRRRSGDDLESVYVAVYEPYRKTPFIDSVRVLPLAGQDLPVALEISMGGRKHVVFSRLETPDGESASILELDGGDVKIAARTAALEQGADGELRWIYLLDNNRSAGLESLLPPPQDELADLTAVVKSVDYEKGEITLSGPILQGLQPAGGTAIVTRGLTNGIYGSAIPVEKILAADRFNVGDNELYENVLYVDRIKGRRLRVYPDALFYVEPGMTVVNEAHEPVGRVVSVGEREIELEEAVGPVNPEHFPDRDGDGRRMIRLMVVGPGDKITLHRSWRRSL